MIFEKVNRKKCALSNVKLVSLSKSRFANDSTNIFLDLTVGLHFAAAGTYMPVVLQTRAGVRATVLHFPTFKASKATEMSRSMKIPFRI